mgnify:CR=1 FL=1
MSVYQITSCRGGLSDYEDKGIAGSFKFSANLDIRKLKDTISSGQALIEEGVTDDAPSSSISPSGSVSPSASVSPSPSPSKSPSASASPSPKSPSSSGSPSSSKSPSASASPSASVSPSSSVSPSPSPSAGLLTVFSDLIVAFVKCSDGKLYGFGNRGKIYKRNSDGYWMQVYDQGKPIRGACEKPSSGGKIYLIWATQTELHRKEIPGNSSWNDVDVAGTVQGDTFPKTNLSDYEWHTMVQVGGDVMIANGSNLAMSAYDDSYTNQALDLIPGNISKTLVERNGHVVIGTYKLADPNKGVNGAVDCEYPLVQVGDLGDIYYADFSGSISMKRFPGGGRVNPYGMTNEISQVNIFDWMQDSLSWIDKQEVGNMALMGVFEADTNRGGIYTFGRKYKNHPFVLNLEYQYDADEIGAVVNIDGTTLFSYKNGTTYGVMAVDSNNKAIGIYEGLDFKAPVKKTIELTEWKTAEIFMKPLPIGCSVEFWYRVDKNGDWVRAKTADGQDSYSYATGKKAVFRIGASGEIFEPRLVLNPYGNETPEVYRARVFFI